MPLNVTRIQHEMRRYVDDAPENLAVAVSGGADSMALLFLVKACASARKVHAIIIDHALRPGSADEAAMTAKRVQAMGAIAIVKTWEHDGIKTAIQEKAREARYALLAQACAQIGTDRLFVGHTQDDQAETVGMRRDAGSGPRGLAGIAGRITAPLWPQTRNLTIVRPLLPVSRDDIRAYCFDKSIAYFDDPSNENPKFQRVAMRRRIASEPGLRDELLSLGREMAQRRDAEDRAVKSWLRDNMTRIDNAGVTIARSALADMPPGALADMLRLVSGQARRADPVKAANLLKYVAAPRFKPRTLGGSLVYDAGDTLGIARDPGVLLGQRGHGPAVMKLPPGETHIWDGRFEVMTDREVIHVGSFWPARAGLDEAAKRTLKAFPSAMRKTLPGFFAGDVLVAVPALGFSAGEGVFTAEDIMRERF